MANRLIMIEEKIFDNLTEQLKNSNKWFYIMAIACLGTSAIYGLLMAFILWVI